MTADPAADALAAVTYPAAAPQNMLSGTAAVRSSQHAYDGQYVGWIGNGVANTLTFTGIHAAQAGAYRVTLSYASSARTSSGNYNVNLIDRGFHHRHLGWDERDPVRTQYLQLGPVRRD